MQKKKSFAPLGRTAKCNRSSGVASSTHSSARGLIEPELEDKANSPKQRYRTVRNNH